MAEASSILNLLQELIETCRDGETGYAHAASIVSDPELKSYFTEQSQERYRLIGELQQLAQRGGEPRPDTSGALPAHYIAHGLRRRLIWDLATNPCSTVWRAVKMPPSAPTRRLSPLLCPSRCEWSFSDRLRASFTPMTMSATCAIETRRHKPPALLI